MKLMALVETCGTAFYNYHAEQGIDSGNECLCRFHVNPNANCEVQPLEFEAKRSNTQTNAE